MLKRLVRPGRAGSAPRNPGLWQPPPGFSGDAGQTPKVPLASPAGHCNMGPVRRIGCPRTTALVMGACGAPPSSAGHLVVRQEPVGKVWFCRWPATWQSILSSLSHTWRCPCAQGSWGLPLLRVRGGGSAGTGVATCARWLGGVDPASVPFSSLTCWLSRRLLACERKCVDWVSTTIASGNSSKRGSQLLIWLRAPCRVGSQELGQEDVNK